MDELIVELVEKFPVIATVVAGLIAAHTAALFVVNLTPTPKDDAFVKRVYKVVEYLAGVVSARSKEK